jgi:hypothetical protein
MLKRKISVSVGANLMAGACRKQKLTLHGVLKRRVQVVDNLLEYIGRVLVAVLVQQV